VPPIIKVGEIPLDNDGLWSYDAPPLAQDTGVVAGTEIAMKPTARANGRPAHPQRWLGVLVVVGLVIGAGGLLPSLLGNSSDRLTTTGAASERGADAPSLPAPPSSAAMLGRLAAGTVFVLALCAGTLPLLKGWLAREPAAKPSGSFEVVATLTLNGRCRVCLVRVGEQHLLAGSDAAGLQVLVPVGDVPADGNLSVPQATPQRRTPAGIEPRKLSAV
jgi:flagellar biogenesis protein FliO